MRNKIIGLHIFFELHDVFNDKGMRKIEEIYPVEILNKYILGGKLLAKEVDWEKLREFISLCKRNATIPVCFPDDSVNKITQEDWVLLCNHVGQRKIAKTMFLQQNEPTNSIRALRKKMKELNINDAIYVCSELTPNEELYMKRYCTGFCIYVYETKGSLIDIKDFEQWIRTL